MGIFFMTVPSKSLQLPVSSSWGSSSTLVVSIELLVPYSLFKIDLGGPDHDRLGFRYWKNPGPFVQFNGIAGTKGRFLGFWAVLTQAAFAYIGTEIVAVGVPSFVRFQEAHVRFL
jgi:amino acid permease